MSLNILNKKYSEAEINNDIMVRGKWKVGVVSQNGEVQFPLGDVWRDNLIQDRGLNMINGTFNSSSVTFTVLSSNTTSATEGIGNLIKSAFFGDSSSEPFATNKTWLTTTTNSRIYWTSRLTVGAPENTTSQTTDDLSAGKRTFRRVWDFPSVDSLEGPVTVREIAISASASTPANGTGSLDQVKGKNYTFNTNTSMFSRFILPSPITLSDFQFLRLYYTIDVTVPAVSVAGTVNVSVQSGSFDGTGKLRLLGQWSSIFGGAGQFYQYRNAQSALLTDSRYPPIPWSMIGYFGCTMRFLKGKTDASQNFTMPSVGSNLNILYSTDPWFSLTTNQNIDQTSAGSTLTPAAGNVTEITPTNNAVSREASMLFPANNPNSTINGPIAGVFIFPQGGLGSLNVPYALQFIPSPNYNNADTAIGGHAWYWQFTDELGNKRSVTKDPNYGLAINIRQTVSR